MYAGLNSPVVVINRRAGWSGNIGQHALILRNKPQILFADSLHPVAAVVSVECMQLQTQMRRMLTLI
jgi:hypothetical protein